MKYFVFTFNIVTLHKAIVYAKEEWGFENTYIMFTTANSAPPKALVEGKYKSLIINPDDYESHIHFKGLNVFGYLQSNKNIVREFMKYISLNAPDRNEEICIVVFRDTLIREAILSKNVRKKYKNVRIIMIEEGLALYAKYTAREFTFKDYIKSVFYVLLGVPLIALRYVPHGCNPDTDEIICSHPQELKALKRGNKKKYVQEIDVFSKENCDFFIQQVMMKDLAKARTYDYVFLSQPLFPMQDENLNQRYETFIKKLFSVLSKHGNTLIKPHPRDAWDYSLYQNEKVKLCPPELMQCAYEILSGSFGKPQTITLYSSAACNGTNSKPVLFLYDFFPDIIDPNIFSEQFIRDNGIIRCGSYEEFESKLYQNHEQNGLIGGLS